MTTIETRLNRQRNGNTVETTIYNLGQYVGFKFKDGIAFLKRTKNGVLCFRNGNARWYHSTDSDIHSARVSVNKVYGLSIRQGDLLEVARVRHFSYDTAEQIVKHLRRV